MTTGTWDDIFGQVSVDLQQIATMLRDTILAIHPAAIQTAKPGWGAVQFGFSARNKEIHSYLMPQKDRINLGFYFGVNLPDPDGLLEGTGKALRHVKLRDMDQAASKPITDLITASVQERSAALGGGVNV